MRNFASLPGKFSTRASVLTRIGIAHRAFGLTSIAFET